MFIGEGGQEWENLSSGMSISRFRIYIQIISMAQISARIHWKSFWRVKIYLANQSWRVGPGGGKSTRGMANNLIVIWKHFHNKIILDTPSPSFCIQTSRSRSEWDEKRGEDEEVSERNRKLNWFSHQHQHFFFSKKAFHQLGEAEREQGAAKSFLFARAKFT